MLSTNEGVVLDLKEWKARWWLYCDKNKDRGFYRYSVDVLSGWMYYTPVYAIQEISSGQDIETVAKNRGLGIVAHALVMRHIGKKRNSLAEKLDITKDSPLLDQIYLNIQATTPTQAAVYGSMLTLGMLMSGSNNWGSAAFAWSLGVVSGAAHGVFYGYLQDGVRSFFGIEKAIDSAENLEKRKTNSKSPIPVNNKF